ncbi:maleylpyruvate isomerase N-terminal domain-containing protein [Micromonospora inyonensis]|uniref:TIGR03083 family protein n=1 Tax=Micromonospora inyonensis TaxID=47866 RepID=A0A1C6SLN2_9ACTN|nr:maleylpyruvate isomerase N-terminal domain-containing protein [Micromonospora inyonensis]SCL30430.1 TIGR03083 family protein [Micromonospora inyonensis]
MTDQQRRSTHADRRNDTWARIHAERAALATDLTGLPAQRFATPSLCAGLTVREVLAHLTAAASLNGWQWFAGVVRCRFDFDKQVTMRLNEQLGADPAETRPVRQRHRPAGVGHHPRVDDGHDRAWHVLRRTLRCRRPDPARPHGMRWPLDTVGAGPGQAPRPRGRRPFARPPGQESRKPTRVAKAMTLSA